MHVKNTLTEYGIISKVLHWLSAILLLIQIPLGFYLVDLDFGEERLSIENIHIIIGLSIFYLVIIRLLNKIFNPTPKLDPSIFKGQKFIAKLNHILLYVAILSITISGILKKLFNGETLVIFFKEIKIQTVPVTQSGKYRPNYVWWKNERAKRQKSLDSYMKKHKNSIIFVTENDSNLKSLDNVISLKKVFPLCQNL